MTYFTLAEITTKKEGSPIVLFDEMVVKTIAEPGYLHCRLIRAGIAVKLCDARSCEVESCGNLQDGALRLYVDTALIRLSSGSLQDKKKCLLNGQGNNRSTGISLGANE